METEMQTRRDFLKIAAMLSGAAGVGGFIPESVQRAYAIEPEAGSTYLDAEHIVILMQENRSFDHTLGTLQGVRGFNDPRAIRLANGHSVFVQTDAKGNSYAPWRLDIRDTRITWMGSIPHSRDSQVDAWNHGHHDGWIEAKRSHVHQYADMPLTMGHYTRQDLPFYYALADAFTVCDQNYSSAMTSTTPNRSFFWTGTVRDEQRTDSKVYMRNGQIFRGGMTWKTFPERLQQAGVSWKFYQNELTHAGGLSAEERAWLTNFGCNVLEEFAAYNVDAYPGSVKSMEERVAALTLQQEEIQHQLQGEKDQRIVEELRTKLASTQSLIATFKTRLADSGNKRYKRLTDQERALHDAAFVTNVDDPNYRTLESLSFNDEGKQIPLMVPQGDLLHQFRKAVNEGTLPTVSWLSAPEKFSDHPQSPWYGAWYVSEVMDILTKNPEVWKKTIFILTYDENDGYFDHAPSFVAADPKRPETGGASTGVDTGIEYTYAEDELRQGVTSKEARSGPIGLGFRVPMIVASPWSRGGWVNSQIFDHTSTLMFLEEFVQAKHKKAVKEENISAWRRTVAGDLTSVFRPHDARQTHLEYLDRDKFVESIQRARYKELPTSYIKLTPAQTDNIHSNLIQSQFISHQEQGIRPSCALPYELYADGALNADGSVFKLRMKAGNDVHGKRSAGAPFNVYLRNLLPEGSAHATEMKIATYAVTSGDAIDQEFPVQQFSDGKYVIEVHGANGFYRSFQGDTRDPGLQVSASYEQAKASLTGNLILSLRNISQHPLTIEVRDNAYGKGIATHIVKAEHEIRAILDLQKSFGWYDVTIRCRGSQIENHFAGRVETGRSSMSDPLMGAAL
jgi:phospholipase C